MKTQPVFDTESAIVDLVSSCHGAIYAYGVIASQLTQLDEALTAISRYRIKRNQLTKLCAELGFTPPPARAAYELLSSITDDASAKAAAALLEESACAHWAAALGYLPNKVALSEAKFLQSCAISSYKWSGIVKAFSSA
jgi:hypothetical protein